MFWCAAVNCTARERPKTRPTHEATLVATGVVCVCVCVCLAAVKRGGEELMALG